MIEIRCQECNRVFEVFPSQMKVGRKFCSMTCKYKHVKRLNLQRTKEELHEIYGRYGSEVAKRPEVRLKISLSKRGPKNPNWKPSIKVRCSYCDKELARKPYQLRSHGRAIENTFCSRKCFGAWRASKMEENNPMKDQEIAAKVHERLRKKIREGTFVPWLRTQRGREIISQISRVRALTNNPMKRLEISAKISGKNHPNWKGGISFEPYDTEFNGKLKGKIRERDDYRCRVCNIPQDQLRRELLVHHLDGYKSNHDLNNLVSVCGSCHNKIHNPRADLGELTSEQISTLIEFRGFLQR